MPKYTVTLEVEAEDLSEVMDRVTHMPEDFSPRSDWTGFKSFTADGPRGLKLRVDFDKTP